MPASPRKLGHPWPKLRNQGFKTGLPSREHWDSRSKPVKAMLASRFGEALLKKRNEATMHGWFCFANAFSNLC
jgi:hypothetical protein